MQRQPPGPSGKFLSQLLVASTDHDQLQRQSRFLKPLDDVVHRLRSKAAKEQHPSRQIRLESQLMSQSNRVRMIGHVEIRSQYHPGRRKNVVSPFAYPLRLFNGALGAADYILLRDRFDPEVRRKVGQIRNQREERPPRMSFTPGFGDFTVEVRNNRYQKVRRVLAKVIRK